MGGACCRQVEAYLAKLDPLVAALAASHPGANYDRRSLGQLFGQLEQLMEDALGIKVSHQALSPEASLEMFNWCRNCR